MAKKKSAIRGRKLANCLVGRGNLLEYKEVCQLYEDAYYEFFVKRPEILEHLLEVVGEIYDDEPSNIKSGIDYLKRGAVRTHIQDIAIRNCLKRLGRNFKGKQILQIRDRVGSHPLSLALSPAKCLFTGQTSSPRLVILNKLQ